VPHCTLFSVSRAPCTAVAHQPCCAAAAACTAAIQTTQPSASPRSLRRGGTLEDYVSDLNALRAAPTSRRQQHLVCHSPGRLLRPVRRQALAGRDSTTSDSTTRGFRREQVRDAAHCTASRHHYCRRRHGDAPERFEAASDAACLFQHMFALFMPLSSRLAIHAAQARQNNGSRGSSASDAAAGEAERSPSTPATSQQPGLTPSPTPAPQNGRVNAAQAPDAPDPHHQVPAPSWLAERGSGRPS
jgi:hypothetical protein